MNDSTERLEVGAALGKCCKCGPSQCLNIAFWHLKRLISKAVIEKTNEDCIILLFYLTFVGSVRAAAACFI